MPADLDALLENTTEDSSVVVLHVISLLIIRFEDVMVKKPRYVKKSE
jgi:hypothetical protein